MKKFLSLLLAMTMILSLVIVPAQAEGPTDIDGLSIKASSNSIKGGDKVTFSVVGVPSVNGQSLKDGATLSYDWNIPSEFSGNPGSAATTDELTAAMRGGSSIKVGCTVSRTYYDDNGEEVTATATLNTVVDIASVVTYTYKISGDVDVTASPSENLKSGDEVAFTAAPNVTVTKTGSDNSTTTVDSKDYDLVYSWNGAERNTTAPSTAKTTLSTDKAAGKLDVTCTVTAEFKTGSDEITGSVSDRCTVNFTNPSVTDQAAAQAEFEAAVKNITVKNRTYAISSGYYYTDGEKNDLENQSKGGVAAVNPDANKYKNFVSIYVFATNKLTVSANVSVNGTSYPVEKEYTVSGTKVAPTVSITKPSDLTGTTVYVGSSYTFKPSFAGSLYGSTSGVKYVWGVEGTDVNTTNSGNNYTVTPGKAGKITITLTATDRGEEEYKATLELTVVANPYTAVAKDKTEFSINTNETLNLVTASAPELWQDYGKADAKKITTNVTGPVWTSDNKTVATVSDKGVVKGLKSGTAIITATLTYGGKNYKVDYTVRVSALDCELASVENGDQVGYTRNELMTAAEKAIYSFDRTNVDVTDITVVLPTSTTYGTFYDDEDCGKNDKVSGQYQMDSGDELYFEPINGYVGKDVKVTLNVKTRSNGNYTVTAVIPVTMCEGKFDDQATDGANTYKVSVPSGYKAYWVLGVNKAPADADYNDTWATKTAGKYSGNTLYSFSSTNLKDGEAKLYIVAIDSEGKAYSGILTLTTSSYTIKYNVVAGKSVDFKQAHFEDFLDTMFKAQSDYNYNNYSAEFDHVRFSSTSSGSSTSGWQLYDGSSKLKTSTDVKDLDDISFSAGSKLTGTIKINFTLYADITRDSTGKTAKSNMPFSGTVEISVINEDIVYEVGVNSFVTFDSADFLKYVQSASSKSAKLDYVTFDVGKNGVVASVLRGTGALYASYSTYGIKNFAKSSDEFYYDANKNQDSLDNVTYATTSSAKVGDIVYIPFTAVTTAKKEVAGTVAIKVKQTMNFTDVHTYDYFYDAVQWAVNNDITKGTSATTFSPKTGCTRAQIVTFLWRAAKSPEPRSNVNKFTDVTTAHADYMKAIIWATEQGITTGTDTNKFSPDATCTRAQIVTFLYRYKNNPAVYGSLNFTDVNKTEHSAYYNAILWAVNNKITTGYGSGIFDPNGTCNRGDAVTFLYRALA